MSKVHIARQGFLTKSAIPTVSRTISGSINASLLVLGDGTNGSTNIVDSSINALTITRIGSPVISTAQFPTGMSSSINLPSTFSYLRLAQNSSLFDIPINSDFTIEMYVYWITHSNFGGLYAAAGGGPATPTGIQMLFDGTTNNITVQGNAVTLITSSSTLSSSTWVHVALSRVSNTLRLFFNGISVGSTTISSAFNNNNSFVYLGAERTAALGINGFISNVRIFNTVGLYSSNFTPPALPLINNTPGTVTINNNIYGVYQNY